ncbi:MAG: hypothetical protein GX443_07710 [Deltaproteobacteria bacterium]|nr:hypothetical protein [Deltaproteobacteria bacterium]
MNCPSNHRQHPVDAPQSNVPLTWQDVLRLYGVSKIPGEEDPFLREFFLQCTLQRLLKYGEEGIREERASLLASAEYLASLME